VRAENLVHGSDQQGCPPGRHALVAGQRLPAAQRPHRFMMSISGPAAA